MSYPDLFTQAQLELATGGPDKLLQLVKPKTDSLASAAAQAFIAEVKSAAAGDVYSLLQVAFDPADATVPAADFVRQNAVTIGLYWAWHKSTGGIAIPDEVKQGRLDAAAALKEAKDGLRSLGTSEEPRSNAGAKNVTVDVTGTRVIRRNMGGFC